MSKVFRGSAWAKVGEQKTNVKRHKSIETISKHPEIVTIGSYKFDCGREAQSAGKHALLLPWRLPISSCTISELEAVISNC